MQTIASNEQEFVFIRDLMAGHVRICRNYLLLWDYAKVFLELEITKGSR